MQAQRSSVLSAHCPFVALELSLSQRMTAKRAATAASPTCVEGRLWAAREGDPAGLDFNCFRNGQSILKFDAEVSDRTVHLGVT